ncbi:MAG TPA: phosphosulfolactate synthase [Bacillota bacterium]|nr:phosphosulfolactate synthase [Bacillota bacterium]
MSLLEIIKPPLPGRNPKPRSSGVTMVIDKGLSLAETTAWLELNAAFIDYIKLAFGTLILYPPETISAKIKVVQHFGIPLYPGGTFLEIAFWEHQFEKCLEQLQELGFEWLEISDGTLNINSQQRLAMIKTALEAGFKVITEVGKKDTANQLHVAEMAQSVLVDLEAGVEKVIIEARESGMGIGIYDREGEMIPEKIALLREVLPLERILWEAPLKKQQVELIKLFGPNVNIGNIAPSEVMALEALRQGLRSDTWKTCLT